MPQSHIDCSGQYGSESPALEVAGCKLCYILIVVQARNDDDDDENVQLTVSENVQPTVSENVQPTVSVH